jgi:hypothetical protein
VVGTEEVQVEVACETEYRENGPAGLGFERVNPSIVC